LIFGIVMILAAPYLWVSHREEDGVISKTNERPDSGKKKTRLVVRNLIDADGLRYHYRYDPIVGIGLSVFVGFLSSLLGVGGGFIHVPALSRLLNFPVHIATATSHYVLAIMALTGSLVHVAQGMFVHGLWRTALLGIGVILGAQTGAWMSNYVGGKVIIRGLAMALAFVGLRLILSEF
jgi:uncharacterized membrane protein YfcA